MYVVLERYMQSALARLAICLFLPFLAAEGGKNARSQPRLLPANPLKDETFIAKRIILSHGIV